MKLRDIPLCSSAWVRLGLLLTLTGCGGGGGGGGDDAPQSALLQRALPKSTSPQSTTKPLPDRFAAWKITVSPSMEFAGALTIAFESPALGRRVQNTVFLPAVYSLQGAPVPVMYYLHGTVDAALDRDAAAAVGIVSNFGKLVGRGGGYIQTEIFDFPGQVARADFAVVAPDTDPSHSICHTCLWINGQKPVDLQPTPTEVMQSETFLLNELQPLLESLFNVRTDRGGRGVMGFSMGGWSALLQGVRHPDLYRFVADLSGPGETDPLVDPSAAPVTEGFGYLNSQGYGTALTRNRVYTEMFNPARMASNMLGADIALFFSSGDGCIQLQSLLAPDCRVPDPVLAAGELAGLRNMAITKAEFAATGLTFTAVQRPGVHGSNNHTVYAKDIIPLANATFASSTADPIAFSHRSGDSAFSIWNYTVNVHRSAPAITILRSAYLSGASFAVEGHDPVVVTTPPRFKKGSAQSISVQCTDGSEETLSLNASADGRLAVRLDLPLHGASCAVRIL